MKSECLLAAALVLTAATTPGIATANESPLADAGLDQTVTRGETVYLDGAGSSDPDGTIEGYNWTITGESGDATSATSPACQTCERTQFHADATGTYRVTLEVTDDDGATATDALFVTVEPGEPPTVSLSGPTRTETGDANRFTADVDSGAAPLSELVWSVDGEPIATEAIDGDADTSTRPTRFPTAGTHDVSVVAFDEDGQRAADQQSVAVTAPDSSTGSSGSGSSTGSGGTSGDADSTGAITGPQVVTGDGRLAGDYELTTSGSAVWMHNGRSVANGNQATLSFEPGDHELYASHDDDVATFPDGSRTVVADPAPELQAVDIEENRVVPIDVHATDAYGNLRSLTIRVDGEVVESVTADDLRGGASEESLSTMKYLNELEPGVHVVTVRARDARGQTDVKVETVSVPGPVEVVSAGFVSDGPLDQYHPRIDESRYTATYQVKVDLNGVDPDNVGTEVRFINADWTSEVRTSEKEGYLIVERDAYQKEILDIKVRSSINPKSGVRYSSRDRVHVTPAPPEIKIEVVDPQNDHSQRLGMELNARKSFDPDYTPTEFDWYGVQGGHRETPKITLNSFNAARLKVGDGQNQTATVTNPISWFAPKLEDASMKEDGPFYPNETITFSITSEQFYLSKNTYEDLTSFSLRSEYGKVTGREKFEEKNGEINDPDPESMSNWYEWHIEVPARSFLDDSPTAATYPTNHPKVEYSIALPEPVVYSPTRTELRNETSSIKYRVERPKYTNRQTQEKKIRDNLLSAGYHIHRVSENGLKYNLEEQVKVHEAKYDVEQLEFDSRGRLGDFLTVNTEWENGGSQIESETVTKTVEEWRSTRNGDGEFTGETRQKLVQDGTYETEKKFQYEKNEEYQTTETYTHTYTTTNTYVEYSEQCGSFGCIQSGTTVTETEYHTETRTRTVTKSRTIQDTYWSTRARSPSHEYTGQSRQITIREPIYERQYRFKIEKEETIRDRIYLAEHKELVERAEYEWQHRDSVNEQLHAETAAAAENVRISDITATKKWILRKQTGTQIGTTTSLKRGWEVLKSLGRSEATLVQHYARKDTKTTPSSRTQEESVIVKHEEPGLITEQKIKEILDRKMTEKYGQ
ncbi:PKD domain-containing protein [Halobacterium bonnevillei]|uniref:PKD/Chitinase domain-containing protein n=1 Tax=Halobacterium bonnevillei TaxID=2692200 RepID=A0A6B0SCR9_9EURY|nr:PKD domain-containing protein [Halobacterium bonnevillei]MXR19494.1 hypothetical protein [Halobacterium bonnevillei]